MLLSGRAVLEVKKLLFFFAGGLIRCNKAWTSRCSRSDRCADCIALPWGRRSPENVSTVALVDCADLSHDRLVAHVGCRRALWEPAAFVMKPVRKLRSTAL